MRNIKNVGAAKIRRLTFISIFVIFAVIFLARTCFVDSKIQVSQEDKAPSSIRTTSTTTQGELNVNQERYYYDLGLLPPYELPDLYQPSTSISVDNAEVKASVVDVYQSNENDDIKYFDELELSLDLESLKDKILNSDSTITDGASQSDLQTDDDLVFDETEFVEDEFDDDFGFEDDFGFGDDSWDGGFADGFNTPFEPFIFAPLIQTQEEYDLFKPQDLSTEELDDDFFSDFYVAGESDQSLYEDGIYYLTLFVNGERSGDVETKFEGTEYSIGVQSLFENIGGILSQSGIDRLFVDAPEYYTVDELNALDVQTEVDVDAFTVSMEFGLDDIPTQYLPITKVDKNTLLNRNEQYGISDANIIEPSFFSFVSSLNLSSSYSYGESISNNTFSNSLSMSNAFSIGKVAIDIGNSFSYVVDTVSSEFDFEVSTWKGFFDIRDKNLRVSFGNTGTSLGTDGTPVGFSIEKNYSYGIDEALSHQFTRTYLLESDAVLSVYINDDEPVIKNLRKGEYILKDFPFKQGANHIKIKIEPKDKIYPIVLDEFDVPYDSRLLSKGDYLYGFSAAISKSELADGASSLFKLPYLDGKMYAYDFSDFDTKFYLNVGLTNTFSLTSSFAFSVEEIQSSFEGVLATMAGPFTGKFFTSFTDLYSPQLYTTISHTIESPIGGFNSSITLKLPMWVNETGELYSSSELNVSLGHSLVIDNFPPLTTSLSLGLNDNGINWKSTFSTNYSPLPGLSLNGSLNISNVINTSELDITLQLGIGYTLLNNLTASQSLSSSGSSSLSLSYKPTDFDSLQFSISGIQYITQTNPVYNISWQHTGSYYSLLLKHNMANNSKILNTTATVSSALFFSDGLFGLGRSAASNFVIVKPQGDLANNPVSIGKTNSSSLNVINPLFGNAVYTQLSANSRNNLIAYGTSKSLYSSGGSFSYELNTNTRTGFAQRLYSPPSYTVSGLLLDAEGQAQVQYSSPVYKLLVDENGLEYLEPDEQLYLFTDLDGRFILSDVMPGTYLFDMSIGNNNWIGLYFTISDDIKSDKKVVLLEDYQLSGEDEEISSSFDVVTGDQIEETVGTFGDDLASDYVEILEIKIDKYEEEETFWNTIFPPLDESVDDLAFEDTAGDWENNTFEEEPFDEAAFFDDPAFADTADDWESTLNDSEIPTVVVDNSNQNPNYTYVP